MRLKYSAADRGHGDVIENPRPVRRSPTFSLVGLMRSDMSSDGNFGVTDPYLPVEEVARRLDLPLGLLVRRVEAGDLPPRREIGAFGVTYSVRLSDLGFDPDATGRTDPSPATVPAPIPATVPDAPPVDMVGSAQNWPVRPLERPTPPPMPQPGTLVATVP